MTDGFGMRDIKRLDLKKTFLIIFFTLFTINALVMYSIRPYGYNFSSMIRLTEVEAEGTVPEYFQKGMVILNGGGYDGQCYYYVAMDPFMEKALYKNSYRHQRVFYPLLSRALAFWDVSLLPYTMYAVNMIALAFGMYYFILMLNMFSMSPYWALLYGLAPPSIMTIQYDLPSPVSMALIIAAFYFYLKDRHYLTAVLFALAFLTREDTIVALVPLMVWDLQVKRKFGRLAVLASSLVPFFLWQFFVTYRLGDIPTAMSSTVLNPVPFLGFWGWLSELRYEGVISLLKNAGSVMIFFYFITVGIIVALRLRHKTHLFYYAVGIYCLLSVFTVPSQWNNYGGLLRMFYGFFPFMVLAYAAEKDKVMKYCAYFIAVPVFITFLRILFISPVYPFKIW